MDDKPANNFTSEMSSTSEVHSNEGKSSFESAFGKLKESSLYSEVAGEIGVSTSGESSSVDSGASTTVIPTTKPHSKNSVLINSRQRGNPIIKYIRNVPWEYSEIVPDYEMGATTCAIFLSLKYHTLNKNYIHERLKKLGRQYELRVLVVQVDIQEPQHELKELTKVCFLADLTMMLAWSPEEAGRIIEVYKIYEHKPPDMIMEKQDSNPYAMIVDALTTIRSVNRSDAMTLLSNFGSIEGILAASQQDLSLCPGIGSSKAHNIYTTLNQSFRTEKKSDLFE